MLSRTITKRNQNFKNLLENAQCAYNERQKALDTGEARRIEKTQKYYHKVIKKLLVLNSADSETKIIKQLLYWTEKYNFLSDDTLDDMIYNYLGLKLAFVDEKTRERFLDMLSREYGVSVKSFDDRSIQLTETSLLSPGVLFNDKDQDTQKMLAQMTTLLQEQEDDEPVDNYQMRKLEFDLRCLTETPFFTYDVNRRNELSKINDQLFYIWEYSGEVINTRKAD